MKKLTLILFFLLNFSLYSLNQENCESAKIKYLELNPDVKQNGMDAWDHFTIFGKKEGRIWPKCDANYQQNNSNQTIINQNQSVNNKNITYDPVLKSIENKLFLNDLKYNGMLYSFYENKQIKSIQEVKDGIIDGNTIEFWFDKSFDSKKYRDTALISNYNIDLQKTKLELSSNTIDTTKAGKDERDFLYNEIGGYEKLQKLREKNNEDKLSKKKKEEFDYYQNLVKSKNNALQNLNNSKKIISDIEKKIKTELSKDIYLPIKSMEFVQLDNKKEGKAIIYNQNGKKVAEGEYKDNIENKKWSYFFPNSNLSEEAEFNLGKLNGTRKLYYENGKLKSEDNFKSGELDGLKKEFFDNGNLQSSCEYINGKKSGVFVIYNNLGKKMNECNFVNDQKNGKELIYNPNNILISDYNYINNDKDGPVKEFYDNGKIKNDYTILKNVKSGKFIKYYDNGQLMEEGSNLNGKQSGEWKYYYNSGKIKSKGSYLDGDGGNLSDLGIPQNGRNGKWLSFHENGKTKQESNWTNGKCNGEVKAFNDQGTITSHYIFKDNIIIEDKLNTSTKANVASVSNSSEMNKPYNCKCCKTKINGLMNGVNKEGEEPDQIIFPTLLDYWNDPSMIQLANIENFGQDPFKNGYDILRKTEYKFCSMKCARTCN